MSMIVTNLESYKKKEKKRKKQGKKKEKEKKKKKKKRDWKIQEGLTFLYYILLLPSQLKAGLKRDSDWEKQWESLCFEFQQLDF